MKPTPSSTRVAARALAAAADQYERDGVVDVGKCVALLRAASHLIASYQAEGDAIKARKTAAARVGAFRRHEESAATSAMDEARALFDRWQAPGNRKVRFASYAEFAKEAVARSGGKLRSVEHLARQASKWAKEKRK